MAFLSSGCVMKTKLKFVFGKLAAMPGFEVFNEVRDLKPGASGIEMGAVPQEGTPFGAMRQRFLSPLGIPCQKPPFGTMTAVDLKSRQIKWQVPVGTVDSVLTPGAAMSTDAIP